MEKGDGDEQLNVRKEQQTPGPSGTKAKKPVFREDSQSENLDETLPDDDRDEDYKVESEMDTSDSSSSPDNEPARPRPAQQQQTPASQPRRKRKREGGVKNPGWALQSRRPFTEERMRRTYPELEATAEHARKFLKVDYARPPLPPPERVRELLFIGGKNCLDFKAATFFTCGPKFYEQVRKDESLKNLQFRYWRNNLPLEGFIHAICGHLVKVDDQHKLCRTCDYVAHRRICYRPAECAICATQTKSMHKQRRDRASRTKKPILMTTIGGRREARDLLGRWYYLEGVLWCLASVYEQKLNLEALKQCRRNIRQLRGLMLPNNVRPPRPKLDGDTSRQQDPLHTPVKAITPVQTQRRGSRILAQLKEDPGTALARLEAAAEDAPATRNVLQPKPQEALNLLSATLFLDDATLEAEQNEYAQFRRNGFLAMRNETRLRFFRVSLKCLGKEEQRVVKLEHLGLDPKTPKKPYVPKPGREMTTRQRAASLREQPPIVQTVRREVRIKQPQPEEIISGPSGMEDSGYDYPPSAPEDDIDDDGDAQAGAQTPARTNVTLRPRIKRFGALPATASARKKALRNKTPPLPVAPSPQMKESTVVLRRSARLAEKCQLRNVNEPVAGRIPAKQTITRRNVGQGWRKFMFLRYRIELYLKLKVKVAPTFPFVRYHYRTRPPKPFVLYSAERILNALNEKNQHIKETADELRSTRGITVLNERDMAEIMQTARVIENINSIAERAKREIATDRPSVAQQLDEGTESNVEQAGPAASGVETSPPPPPDAEMQVDAPVDHQQQSTESASAPVDHQQQNTESEGAPQVPVVKIEPMEDEQHVEQVAQFEEDNRDTEDESTTHSSPETAKPAGVGECPLDLSCGSAGSSKSNPAGVQNSSQESMDVDVPAEQLAVVPVGASQPSEQAVLPVAAVAPLETSAYALLTTTQTYVATSTRMTAVPMFRYVAPSVLGAATPNVLFLNLDNAQQVLPTALGPEATPQTSTPAHLPLQIDVPAPELTPTQAAALPPVPVPTQAVSTPSPIALQQKEPRRVTPIRIDAEPAKEGEVAKPSELASDDTTSGAAVTVVVSASTETDTQQNKDESMAVEETEPTAEVASADPSGPGESLDASVTQPSTEETATVGAASPPARTEPASSAAPTGDDSPDSSDSEEVGPRPQGVISEREWEEFCFRSQIYPDKRPMVDQILEEYHETVDNFNNQIAIKAVRAVIKMHELFNRPGGGPKPSMEEITQMIILLNKFLQKYPDYVNAEDSPCDDLTVLYARARAACEKELNVIIKAIDKALETPVQATDEEQTSAAFSVTNKVYARVDRLLEELGTARKERAQFEQALEQSTTERDRLKSRDAALNQELKALKENLDKVEAHALQVQAKSIAAEKQAREAKQMHDAVLANHAQELRDQREHYEAVCGRQKDEIAHLKERLKEAEKGRKFSQRAYDAEWRRLKKARENQPAAEEEARALSAQLEEIRHSREVLRKQLVDKEVELERAENQLSGSAQLLNYESQYMQQAARNMCMAEGSASTAPQPPNVGAAVPQQPAPQLPVAPRIEPFDENLARLKAERRHVSTPTESSIIPDDLIEVEPMDPSAAQTSPQYWDFYYF